MAKGNKQNRPSDFDRFKSDEDEKNPAASSTVVAVTDEDSQESALADLLAQGEKAAPVKIDVASEAAKGRTMLEQEEIIARLTQTPYNGVDPAEHYRNALVLGRQVPEIAMRPEAHPLLVECYQMFERIMAGGLLAPGAVHCNNGVVDLLTKLRGELEAKEVVA